MSAQGAMAAGIEGVMLVNDTLAVERLADIGVAEFVAKFRRPRRPVILTDAARAWPLYGKVTPDYFRREYGDRVVRVRGHDYNLQALMDMLEASTVEQPGPYPCKFEIAKDFRELIDGVVPRFGYSLPDRQASRLLPQQPFRSVNNLEIFFGGPGGEFPYLHYDVMRLHAWITQLYGDKEFTVYAPDQEHLLYVNPDIPWQSSIKDHHHPDYEKYPLFRQAKATKIVVRAGETLFLPCGWWHTARSLNTTISIAFDQLGPDNWPAFIVDVVEQRRRHAHPVKAFLLGSYMRMLGSVLSLTERFGASQSQGWGNR